MQRDHFERSHSRERLESVGDRARWRAPITESAEEPLSGTLSSKLFGALLDKEDFIVLLRQLRERQLQCDSSAVVTIWRVMWQGFANRTRRNERCDLQLWR